MRAILWMVRIKVVTILIGFAAPLLTDFGSVIAQDFPSRPVRIIVAYPPGGAVDTAARVIAQQLSVQTGARFVVDNKPGAAGNIGTQLVADAAPDGYTLLFSGPNITITPALMKDVTKFNPNTSFVHLGRIVTSATVLAVNGSSKLKSLDELIEYARANPGKLTYGSPGAASPSKFAMELLKSAANVDIREISYGGAAPAIADLLGGQIDIVPTVIASFGEQIRTGRIKALAITSAKRDPLLPQVPAVSESLPNFAAESWSGLAAPRDTPVAVQERLAREIRTAMSDPDTLQRMRSAGLTPSWLDGNQLAEIIRRDTAAYAKLVESAIQKGK